MQSVREYVDSVAPEDVRATLDWLEDEGYTVVRSRGGPSQPMGDAVVVLAGAREVTITRDKGQWEIRLAVSPGEPGLWLDVLDAARLGRDWQPAAPDGRLPEQLPEGLSWRRTLPAVLAWLDSPGAEDLARAAMAGAREQMQRRWRERHPGD